MGKRDHKTSDQEIDQQQPRPRPGETKHRRDSGRPTTTSTDAVTTEEPDDSRHSSSTKHHRSEKTTKINGEDLIRVLIEHDKELLKINKETKESSQEMLGKMTKSIVSLTSTMEKNIKKLSDDAIIERHKSTTTSSSKRQRTRSSKNDQRGYSTDDEKHKESPSSSDDERKSSSSSLKKDRRNRREHQEGRQSNDGQNSDVILKPVREDVEDFDYQEAVKQELEILMQNNSDEKKQYIHQRIEDGSLFTEFYPCPLQLAEDSIKVKIPMKIYGFCHTKTTSTTKMAPDGNYYTAGGVRRNPGQEVRRIMSQWICYCTPKICKVCARVFAQRILSARFSVSPTSRPCMMDKEFIKLGGDPTVLMGIDTNNNVGGGASGNTNRSKKNIKDDQRSEVQTHGTRGKRKQPNTIVTMAAEDVMSIVLDQLADPKESIVIPSSHKKTPTVAVVVEKKNDQTTSVIKKEPSSTTTTGSKTLTTNRPTSGIDTPSNNNIDTTTPTTDGATDGATLSKKDIQKVVKKDVKHEPKKPEDKKHPPTKPVDVKEKQTSSSVVANISEKKPGKSNITTATGATTTTTDAISGDGSRPQASKSESTASIIKQMMNEDASGTDSEGEHHHSKKSTISTTTTIPATVGNVQPPRDRAATKIQTKTREVRIPSVLAILDPITNAPTTVAAITAAITNTGEVRATVKVEKGKGQQLNGWHLDSELFDKKKNLHCLILRSPESLSNPIVAKEDQSRYHYKCITLSQGGTPYGMIEKKDIGEQTEMYIDKDGTAVKLKKPMVGSVFHGSEIDRIRKFWDIYQILK